CAQSELLCGGENIFRCEYRASRQGGALYPGRECVRPARRSVCLRSDQGMGNGLGRHESVIGITAVQVEFVAHSKLTAQRWRQQGVGVNEGTTHRCVTCRVVDAIKRTTEQICESRGDVVMNVILVFWNGLAGGVQNDGIVWGCQ